jgi:PIN domain nuclease of toxin-antitoxin system
VRLLLDTHAFLWFIAGHRSLSTRARRAIESSRNEKYLSVASVWEMAIKVGLGKLKLGIPLRDTLDAGISEGGIAVLPVERDHALGVAELPWHHEDPFDRLLIAQARAEDLRMVTADGAFDGYDVSRLW